MDDNYNCKNPVIPIILENKRKQIVLTRCLWKQLNYDLGHIPIPIYVTIAINKTELQIANLFRFLNKIFESNSPLSTNHSDRSILNPQSKTTFKTSIGYRVNSHNLLTIKPVCSSKLNKLIHCIFLSKTQTHGGICLTRVQISSPYPISMRQKSNSLRCDFEN